MKIPTDTDIVMDPETREMRLTWRGVLRFWAIDFDWRKPELRLLPPRGYGLVAPVARFLVSRKFVTGSVYVGLWLVIWMVLNALVFGARFLLGLWT